MCESVRGVFLMAGLRMLSFILSRERAQNIPTLDSCQQNYSTVPRAFGRSSRKWSAFVVAFLPSYKTAGPRAHQPCSRVMTGPLCDQFLQLKRQLPRLAVSIIPLTCLQSTLGPVLIELCRSSEARAGSAADEPL